MKRFFMLLALAALTAWAFDSAYAGSSSTPVGGGGARGGCCGSSGCLPSVGSGSAPHCATAVIAVPVPTICDGIVCPKCLAAVAAADKEAPAKEVKLEGMIACSKCNLKQTAKCGNAIVVKEGGKDVIYFFEDKGNGESYHEEVCGGAAKAGTVVGTVTEKDGKKYIKPSKVSYTKG